MKKILTVIIAICSCVAAHAIILPYGPGIGRTADFMVNSTKVVGGYVVSGTLLSGKDQRLRYNSTSTVLLAGGSSVSFSDGYVKQGLTAWSSVQDLKQGVSYASNRSFYVKPCTTVVFESLYLVSGVPAYDQMISFDVGAGAYMSSGSGVKFVGGFLSEGTLSQTSSYFTLPYGPLRSVTVKGGSSVYFGGANIVNGKRYLLRGLKSQYAQSLQISSTQSVLVQAHASIKFAAGYYVP